MPNTDEEFLAAMQSSGVAVEPAKSNESPNPTGASGGQTQTPPQPAQAQPAQAQTASVSQNGAGGLELSNEKIEEFQLQKAYAEEVVSVADGVLDDLKTADAKDKQEVVLAIQERLMKLFPDTNFAGLDEISLKQFARDSRTNAKRFLDHDIHKTAKFTAEKESFDRAAEQLHPWLSDGKSRLSKEMRRYEKKYPGQFKSMPELKLILANALKFSELQEKLKGGKGKAVDLKGNVGRGTPTDAAPKTNLTAAVADNVKIAVAKFRENPDNKNLKTNVFAAKFDDDFSKGRVPAGWEPFIGQGR